MAKKAPKRKYQELTTPTTTSRVLTWLMLLIVPVTAFFLGMRYQESLSNIEILDMKDQLLMEQFESASPSAETITDN